jgi:hypothetical protein
VPADNSETVESSILRRRRLIKRAALLGIPAMLTLHGRAFASGTGGWSGGMSGSMSGGGTP